MLVIEQTHGKLLKAGCRQTASSKSQFKMFVLGHSEKRIILSFEKITLQQDLALSLIKTDNTFECIISLRPAMKCCTNRFH